jgi:hypothetical protein
MIVLEQFADLGLAVASPHREALGQPAQDQLAFLARGGNLLEPPPLEEVAQDFPLPRVGVLIAGKHGKPFWPVERAVDCAQTLRSQPIVTGRPFGARLYQIHLAQQRQVVRDRGRAQAQHRRQIRDAALTTGEDTQDAQPALIRERLQVAQQRLKTRAAGHRLSCSPSPHCI